jgi:tripartite-type tricarboxylate transporter receptor subunit TctC
VQFRAVVVPKNTPEEVRVWLSDMFGKIAKSAIWENEYLKANMVEGEFLPYQEAQVKLEAIYKMYQEMIAQIKL